MDEANRLKKEIDRLESIIETNEKVLATITKIVQWHEPILWFVGIIIFLLHINIAKQDGKRWDISRALNSQKSKTIMLLERKVETLCLELNPAEGTKAWQSCQKPKIEGEESTMKKSRSP